MKHHQNENKHGQDWGTSSFKKPWSVLVASEWSNTEVGKEVQVSLGLYLRVTEGKTKTWIPEYARLVQ